PVLYTSIIRIRVHLPRHSIQIEWYGYLSVHVLRQGQGRHRRPQRLVQSVDVPVGADRLFRQWFARNAAWAGPEHLGSFAEQRYGIAVSRGEHETAVSRGNLQPAEPCQFF